MDVARALPCPGCVPRDADGLVPDTALVVLAGADNLWADGLPCVVRDADTGDDQVSPCVSYASVKDTRRLALDPMLQANLDARDQFLCHHYLDPSQTALQQLPNLLNLLGFGTARLKMVIE